MPNIINQYGQVKVGVRTQAGGITPLLLDTYSGASAAYSLRKLRTAYSGYAIRVRRSSDNTEQNIGFDSNGNLDTYSLSAFVGSGNGFVTTWYDQGASGYNLTQSIASNQPSIVLSGVLNTQNSKPVLITDFNSFMTNGSLPLNGTTNSIFNVIKLTATRGAFAMMSGYSSYNQHWPSRDASGNNRYYDSGGSNITASPLPNGYNLINLHENASGITVYENNSNLVTNFAHDVISTTGIFIFRRDVFDGNYMPNGSGYSELVIYGSSSKLSDNSGISANINTYYSIYSSDADAQAFITAAGITDTTQKSAINTLVTDLKSANIWTKMKAIYPFVGGTATSHKFNLKDPRDLDAAFRLVFNGGWTHSSTGALPNGTNGYADTKLNAQSNLSVNNTHTSIYCVNNIASVSSYPSFGANLNSTTSFYTSLKSSGNQYYQFIGSENGSISYGASYTNTDTRGFFLASRTSTTSLKAYKNNVFKNETTLTNTGTLPNINYMYGVVGASGGFDGATFNNYAHAFASIGNGLTDAEALAFYNAVQAYQTTLGRQV